jgi:ribonucleoside-diphosphate reductase beta chain
MIDISERKLIEGKTNNLMALHPLKHPWAKELFDKMRENSWHESEVDLSMDAKQFKTGVLNEGNLFCYKKALAFLSNLDGIQFNSLTTNIGRWVTSPEVQMCISRQVFEEAQHVASYDTMISSIGFEPEEIYYAFENDPLLANKNEFITKSSQLLGKGFSGENFAKAIVANVALEGIYFFSGFMVFFNLERQGLMRGSAKMIRFIKKEEITHMNLFFNMWQTLKAERPELFTPELLTQCREIIRLAAEHEIMWGKYIISHGVLGLTDIIVESFIRDLANERITMLELGEGLYKGNVNLAKWFEKASSGEIEENFFESKVSNYSIGALEW